MIKYLINLFTFKSHGPSKIKTDQKSEEIIHKKCGNTLYYDPKNDIIFGDMECISETESIRRGYLNCPYCKTQLVFDYNV